MHKFIAFKGGGTLVEMPQFQGERINKTLDFHLRKIGAVMADSGEKDRGQMATNNNGDTASKIKRCSGSRKIRKPGQIFF